MQEQIREEQNRKELSQCVELLDEHQIRLVLSFIKTLFDL